MASLFSDFLTALGVRHTDDYSDRRFEEMPFQSMFGLADLLKEYGIGSVGVSVDANARDEAVRTFPLPFLADTVDGFIIVMKIENGDITYMSQHKTFTASISEIVGSWNGVALLASSDKGSIEPEYTRHHIAEIAKSIKSVTLKILVVTLLGFSMWQSGLWSNWSAWLLLLFNSIGIFLSWMLVQKSLGIHNNTAEAVCSVLEEGGCDELARSEASSFMGIFKWSEVGMAYFSVSLVAMLLFPQTLPALAAINILCLPYTIWSITYQKFIAKVWCTLCVSVQITLWLLFAAFILGGWTGKVLPFTTFFWLEILILGCCYVAVLLAINRFDDSLMKYLKNRLSDNDNS